MDVAELAWIAWTTPITTSLGAALAASDFSGRALPQVRGHMAMIQEGFDRPRNA
jgi:hypothetical protein